MLQFIHSATSQKSHDLSHHYHQYQSNLQYLQFLQQINWWTDCRKSLPNLGLSTHLLLRRYPLPPICSERKYVTSKPEPEPETRVWPFPNPKTRVYRRNPGLETLTPTALYGTRRNYSWVEECCAWQMCMKCWQWQQPWCLWQQPTNTSSKSSVLNLSHCSNHAKRPRAWSCKRIVNGCRMYIHCLIVRNNIYSWLAYDVTVY